MIVDHGLRRCLQDNWWWIHSASRVRTDIPDVIVGYSRRASSSSTSSALFLSQPSIPSEQIDNVFSQDDLVVGTIIAVVLSITISFLQSLRSQKDFVLWTNHQKLSEDTDTDGTVVDDTENTNVFDADSWKEMSRPENYVLYNTRLRRKKIMTVDDERTMQDRTRQENEQKNMSSLSTKDQPHISAGGTIGKTERRVVLFALLLLFVPIFSVEFFFALSRQLLCDIGDPLQQSDWAVKLCSPVNTAMK